MMAKIAIVYASRHGHVRAISEQLAAIAALRGVECTLYEVAAARHGQLTEDCDAVVIAGSVHFGRHARVLRRFVKGKLAVLSSVPSAFLSVSGSAVALEGRTKAEEYITDFIRVTGWQPDLTLSVAGALLYTKYDPITRLVMKFASRIAGRGTDTSRDYDYTNWPAVDAFMHQFIDTVERHTAAEQKD
jgi:menaquinone-dependent protoporphyrinogen oxidase